MLFPIHKSISWTSVSLSNPLFLRSVWVVQEYKLSGENDCEYIIPSFIKNSDTIINQL